MYVGKCPNVCLFGKTTSSFFFQHNFQNKQKLGHLPNSLASLNFFKKQKQPHKIRAKRVINIFFAVSLKSMLYVLQEGSLSKVHILFLIIVQVQRKYSLALEEIQLIICFKSQP